MWWRWKKKILTKQVIVIDETRWQPPVADNDDCFWASLLGPGRPFEQANHMRRLRRRVIERPDPDPDFKRWRLEGCDLYLKVFHLVHIEKNAKAVRHLAPLLNDHIPELMLRCPDKELRPEIQDYFCLDF